MTVWWDLDTETTQRAETTHRDVPKLEFTDAEAGAREFPDSNARRFNYYTPQKRKQSHYEDVTVEVQPDPRHYLSQGWLYGFSDGRGGYPLDWTALKAWGSDRPEPERYPGSGGSGYDWPAHGWHEFRDPNEEWELTLYRYNANVVRQINANIETARETKAFEQWNRNWVTFVERNIGAWMHVEHGLGLHLFANANRRAPTNMHNNAISVNSIHKMRFAQDLALYNLTLSEEIDGFDGAAHIETWNADPAWQGVREVAEQLTAIDDWCEAIFAANVVFEPLVGELFRSHLVQQAAPGNGDFVTPTIVGAGEYDYAQRDLRYTIAMFELLTNDREFADHNKALLDQWLQAWVPRAISAARTLQPLWSQPDFKPPRFEDGLDRAKSRLSGILSQLDLGEPKELTHERGTAEPTWPSEGAAAGGGAANGGSHDGDPPGGGGSGSAGGNGGSHDGDPTGAGGSQSSRRYLMGQCQESVRVGKSFSLIASIVLVARPTGAELKVFDVPPEGQDVLLVVHAPGLQLLGDQQQIVHVPPNGDSEPVRFELRADTPGPQPIWITAWIGGSYLGELFVEITAERDRPPGPHREVLAEITTESIDGAVSLVVRYDPKQNAYRFEFRDEDNPDEVPSNLAYEPGPLVEQLVAELDTLAKGRSGYSPTQTRDYLVNAGAGLWRELVPEALREQFWDRQQRIRQLTILADKDVVPWELLYPLDPSQNAGFLVEQFPVTRAIFGWRPARTLRLRPTRFVLPEASLPKAQDEIDAMRQLLDPGQPLSEVISALTPLTELIRGGNFGLLHFACHNTYDPAGGSSIRLGGVQFTPTLMTTSVIEKVLRDSAPTVFMNACRSAGEAATYNRLDGWASKFLQAGAGAFIGSLWAVSDGAAREFAQEFYSQLRAGSQLGEAAMQARRVTASQPGDPTWLAYTVYGDPRATISRQRP